MRNAASPGPRSYRWSGALVSVEAGLGRFFDRPVVLPRAMDRRVRLRWSTGKDSGEVTIDSRLKVTARFAGQQRWLVDETLICDAPPCPRISLRSSSKGGRP